MEKIVAALPAFVVAMVGVGFAWLALHFGLWLPLVVAFTGVLLGYGVDAWGKRLLPDHPVAAVRAMEWWIITPGMIASLAAGGLILIAVELIPEEGWSPENKEIVAAIVSALSVFLTTVIIKSTDEADNNWVAPRVRAAFFASYRRDNGTAVTRRAVRYFPAGSDGERWVYSGVFKGIEGWGRSARLARARGVREALESD